MSNVTIRCRTCNGRGAWLGFNNYHDCDDCHTSGWITVPQEELLDTDYIDVWEDDCDSDSDSEDSVDLDDLDDDLLTVLVDVWD